MKKYLKTALSLMLVFAMTAALVIMPAAQTAYAAKTVKAKSVKLNHKVYTIKKGKTVTLKATVSPKNSTQKTIVWTSGNKKVATVKAGKVKGLKKGKVTITAKVKGTKKTAKATIYVGTPVSSVKLKNDSVVLNVGDTASVNATVSPSNATLKTITYSSSDNSVATVTSKGEIIAKGAGTAIITAAPKDEAGKKAKMEVVVTDIADPEGMSVAMITDYGDITDQSFNQTTYETCKAFCEANNLAFTYKKPASDTDAARESSIKQAIKEGYNVIVMPGYAFANAIYDLAPSYPNIKFVAIDVSEDDVTAYGEREFSADNLCAITFKEETAGYMAGYAAVKLGYTKLGFLGAIAIPAVKSYGYSFIQGADAAAGELGIEGVEVKYVYGGQFFGNDKITSAMKEWYEDGTECIFACGGGIFTSVAEAAANKGGKLIGVDVDQAEMIDGAYGAGITLTSAVKNLDQAISSALTNICNDKWDECKGFVRSGFGALPDSTQWSDSFTKADYEQLSEEIISGARPVTDDISGMPAATHVTVQDLGNL